MAGIRRNTVIPYTGHRYNRAIHREMKSVTLLEGLPRSRSAKCFSKLIINIITPEDAI